MPERCSRESVNLHIQMEKAMINLKLLGLAAALTSLVAAPAFAQEGGVIGPGSRYGLTPEPPSYYQDYQGSYPQSGFAPFDAAAGIVNGAVNTAGAIATAPFRAWNDNGSYAMMQGDNSYCAQRFRSYDPRSGTYLGYDGQRHPCG